MGSGGGGGGSDYQPVQPTADMFAQQKINANLWNYYQTDYKPIIKDYVQRTTNATTLEEEKKQVAGQVNAETMKNIDPSKVTGNAAANLRQISGIEEFGTKAQVQGQGGVRSRQLAEVQNVIDIGRGKATTAQAGMNELASQSVRSAIANEEIQQQQDAAIENAYGSAAGAIGAGLMKLTSSGAQQPRSINPMVYSQAGA